MIRQLTSSILAFLLALLVVGGGISSAQAGTLRYRAEPVTPQERATLVVKDIVWKCAAGACVAPRSQQPPGDRLLGAGA